jgi:eukaryotic-like serine/threonine-protein kinase
MIRERISRYRLLEEIGTGGVGVVYRARDEHLDREVALKVLRSGARTDESARKRFRREARALSLLSHPGISTVFDFDSHDGLDFLVMELVAGENLQDRLRGTALPERDVVDIGAQIAGALAAAHEQGVIHRDLKPGNVIVTPKGAVKLLDFGLALLCPDANASASPETRSLTDLGHVVGTLAYMSPEQLLGKESDERSDLYSLGVLLYEMATGRRPFDSSLSTALVNDILHRPAPRPGTHGVQLTPSLESLLFSLLEKDPKRRPGSAALVEAALRAIGSPTPAAGQGTAPPPWSPDGPPELLSLAAAAATVLAPAGIESLVVLPLENLSRDPEQEFFADGMTEALITNLAQIRALKVVSRTSAMQYKGARKPLPQIARELRVDAVVEGTVARFGDRVRITAQLIEAATDRHLWARSYERDLSDVLALQGEVARAIADEVQVHVSQEERTRMASARRVDPEAYELYLRGRHHWNRRTDAEIRKGIDYFQKAIAKDPKYAQAHAGLSRAYDTMGTYNFLPPAEAFAQAAAEAARALELDNSLPEAHTALGGVLFTHHWDWKGAESEFRQALALDSNYPDAYHWYSDYLSAMGRPEEALAAIRRAHALEPLSLTINMSIGTCLFYARRFDDTIAQQRGTLEFDPTFTPALRNLGGAYEQKGMYAEAIEAYRKAMSLSPHDVSAKGLLAHAFAASGDRDEARRLLRELTDQSARRFVSSYSLAAIHIGLGEIEPALELLERSYRDRDRALPWIKVAPRLDPVRGEPRFTDLLRRMKLIE